MQSTLKSIFKLSFFIGLSFFFLTIIQSFSVEISPCEQVNFCLSDSLYYPKIDSGENIIHHKYYDLVYDEDHEQAKWIFYKLYPTYLDGPFKRKNNFRSDPKISTGSANHEDYRGSGYDRGHLMPAADMTWSADALSESFFYSNMSPQHPSFNRGVWKRLESKVRDWGRESDSMFVVTGPIFDKNASVIGPNRVSIPNAYYKVVLRFKAGKSTGIAFQLSNEASKEDLISFSSSIDELELSSGLDFFYKCVDSTFLEIESEVTQIDWEWN